MEILMVTVSFGNIELGAVFQKCDRMIRFS